MNHSSNLLTCFFVFIALMCSLMLGGANTAIAATYEITEASCMTSPGGYWWAIQQANANPGRDTIQVRTSFSVDDCTHFPAEQYPDLHVTESVDIVGNGFTIDGNVGWLDPNGKFNQHGHCPSGLTVDTWVAFGGGFIDIGKRNADNAGIEVTVTGLKMNRLTGVAIVRKNAKLRIENSYIQDTYSVYHEVCNEPIIEALDHSDVTLVNTQFIRVSVPTTAFPSTDFPVTTSAIRGYGGNLVMDRVLMDGVFGEHTTAVGWFGGTAKIVSSQFVDSRGIWLDNGTVMDFVNSTYMASIDGLMFNDNFLIGNATAKFQASTFWWGLWGDPCDPNPSISYPAGKPCAPRVLGFVAVGSSIRFEGSAIGGQEPFSEKVLMGSPSQFSSDAKTWVQPRAPQNAAAINAILPNALTAAPGLHDYPSFDSNEYFRDITPLVPGLLIEAVPTAGTGGANELKSPIDNLSILKDVLGNPRVYANNTRNIGAVQNADAPVLQATGGDSKVDLGWNTPAGTKTGYEICTSTSALTDPFVGSCTGTTTAVADPASTYESIASLTNGTPYWFVIRTVNSGTPGIWSNMATATPSGVPGTPAVTATSSDGQVGLSWTTPAANGSAITGYVVKYRQQGAASWASWAYSGTGTSTAISSLTNGVNYECEVSALNSSPANIGLGQGQGAFGSATATPSKPLILAYPDPIQAFNTFAQTINPALSNLLGTPTYSLLSGTLPGAMTLNPNTGVISGVPAGGSAGGTPFSITVQLSQSGPPAQTTTAALTINVLSLPPSLQLIYPDLLNVPVGSGPYSLAPSVSGFTGPITYSVVAPDVLPAGLILNSSTGIISGSPTTATSGVVTPTIRAEAQGGAEVRQNLLEISILPVLSYPPANPILGTPFALTPTVSPVVTPGSYSLVAGTLPAGLTLNTTTGVVSGTPSTADSEQVTIRYTTGSQQVSAHVLITVSVYSITLTYPTSSVTIGPPVNLLPSMSGAKGTPTYSLTSGQLPAGLTLNSATGAISGTPSGPAGASQVEITVTDSYTSSPVWVSINVQAPVSIPTLSEWGMILLSSLIIMLAFARMRMQQTKKTRREDE